jgi:hypothetical protein
MDHQGFFSRSQADFLETWRQSLQSIPSQPDPCSYLQFLHFEVCVLFFKALESVDNKPGPPLILFNGLDRVLKLPLMPNLVFCELQ